MLNSDEEGFFVQVEREGGGWWKTTGVDGGDVWVRLPPESGMQPYKVRWGDEHTLEESQDRHRIVARIVNFVLVEGDEPKQNTADGEVPRVQLDSIMTIEVPFPKTSDAEVYADNLLLACDDHTDGTWKILSWGQDVFGATPRFHLDSERSVAIVEITAWADPHLMWVN